MINEVLADTQERMEKTIDSLRSDLMSIRTGRASPAILDRLTVEYYGMPVPLQQLATISVPEAQQLAIRPYSAQDLSAIEKAIAKSNFVPKGSKLKSLFAIRLLRGKRASRPAGLISKL